MKLLYAAIGVIILSLSSISSGQAANCPPVQAKNVDQKYVNAFLKLAQTMEVGCLVNYAPTGQGILMEFISENDNVKSWKKLMTVTLYDSGSKTAAEVVTPLATQYLNTVASAGGNPTVLIKVKDPKFGDIYGFKYALKNGANVEYANGVARSMGDHIDAIILYQQRKEIAEPLTVKFLSGAGIPK